MSAAEPISIESLYVLGGRRSAALVAPDDTIAW